jgi:hypothetical protein
MVDRRRRTEEIVVVIAIEDCGAVRACEGNLKERKNGVRNELNISNANG